jgi:hypothetical protein
MGETLRETAILVAVFYTLDIVSDKLVPPWLNWAVLASSIFCLSLGIALEVVDN